MADQLASMAERVEDVHFCEVSVPEGLSVLLQRMIGEMEVRIKKEDLILFPTIRRGGILGIKQPITVMRANHAGHLRQLLAVRFEGRRAWSCRPIGQSRGKPDL
ncbi:hypothetical protein E3U26_11820 [Paracoccus ferrooxidans]|uniref:Regulator of cell morphogenesis and NO signaling n=2 Tax=Paracoccus TaxID=265 RepID=A0A1N7A770_9RHOB|nr:hypothetical protein E3U26_11820 [Paracoccus ferrooxidans]SIR34878.1 regulator of cell morphogenesis and NO signaling [Paracoccus thiocyanatus]